MDGANELLFLTLDFMSEFPAEIISVIGTIVCVILFYIYLQRLDIQLAGDTSHQDDLTPIQETKVATSTLPFSIKFLEESSAPASFTDGVQLTAQTRVPCFLQGFWVVDCSSFSEMLRSDNNLSDRAAGLYLEEKLQDVSYTSSEKHFLNADTSKSVHLKVRNGLCRDRVGSGIETDCDLGPTPRSKYPLVILMSLHNEDYQAESHDVSIHTMLWVVHLPDSVVTKPLHIISHMLITSQGLVCDIQKMFMASDETSGPDETGGLPEAQAPGNDDSSRPCNEHQVPSASQGDKWSSDGRMDFSRSCIVCQNAPITRVIIPCRHACVCELCLGVLNACPMCRGVIGSHFKLDSTGNTEENSEEGLSDIADRHNDWKMRLWNMNETLNAWFGFR